MCPQVRWWKHLHLRPIIFRKKIYCRSTLNQWQSLSHQNCLIKFSIDAGLLITVDVGQLTILRDSGYTLRRDEESSLKWAKQPVKFTGCIIFMTVFNDISSGFKENDQEFEISAQLASVFARRFSTGRLSYLGPGSEKWYFTPDYSPRGEWDLVAELLMVKFGENGHPVFRATSPLSRGTLRSNAGAQFFDTLLCRTVKIFSHNNFCYSAQYLRSNPTHFSRQLIYW